MTSYGEGLHIPLTAAQQTIGAEVPSIDQLLPSDLVVVPVAQKDDCTPSQRNQGRHVAYVPTRCGVHFAPGLWRSW